LSVAVPTTYQHRRHRWDTRVEIIGSEGAAVVGLTMATPIDGLNTPERFGTGAARDCEEMFGQARVVKTRPS
jgi:hypothetical protein